MKRTIFIKFGGSLITDKSKPNSVRLESIKSLSNQIKDIISSDKNISIILGTGAGSFGHHLVHNYGLKDGIKDKDQVLNVAEVQNAVATLNRIVVSALVQSGVPAVSVNPSSIFTAKNHTENGFFSDTIIGFLSLGMIPVIYGDMIYDMKKGATVFSTEKQLSILAHYLRGRSEQIDMAVFCGTTDGVLDKNKKTISLIDREVYKENKEIYFENNALDVTGEMKQKVETCLNLSSLGIKNYIINGQKENALSDLILKNINSGTVI